MWGILEFIKARHRPKPVPRSCPTNRVEPKPIARDESKLCFIDFLYHLFDLAGLHTQQYQQFVFSIDIGTRLGSYSRKKE